MTFSRIYVFEAQKNPAGRIWLSCP